MKRCVWPKTDLEIKYHDEEWGKVTHDDRYIFEMFVLEMMQAGLSWRTVLGKRENYRHAFYNFDAFKIAEMTQKDIEPLYHDIGLIRHKNKIDAIVHNAKLIVKHDLSLSTYLWAYVDGPIVNDIKSKEDILSKNELSTQISQDLKNLGFKFVGPVMVYSLLEAIGILDNHANICSFKTTT
ncbi:MAG TPA: DNA-3-methyladenine glycosylase I [Erysipelothrix sp.]|nr:DNA-3-methyladenine glycosylase I [Erysipelothrix sp.]